jgi:hypothetical protein
MLRRAECGKCGGWLPLDCGFFTFRLPPRVVQCHQCGQVNQTTPAYRSTWLGQQIFRALLIAGTLLGFSLAFFEPQRFLFVAVCGTIFGGLVGMAAGAIAGSLLAPFVRMALDMRHNMHELDAAPPLDTDDDLTDAPAQDSTEIFDPRTQSVIRQQRTEASQSSVKNNKRAA